MKYFYILSLSFLVTTAKAMEINETTFVAYLQNSWVDVDDNAIASFERRIGVRLPDSYRHFLTQHNGGTLPDFLSYEVPAKYQDGSVNESAVHLMFSLECPDELSYRSLDHIFKAHRTRIPDFTIPIGTSGEDLTLLDWSNGEIVYWVRDDELIDADPNKNRHVLAKSFQEYCDGYRLQDVRERKGAAIELAEPFCSVEAHDMESFDKWRVGLVNGLQGYAKKTKLFCVACLSGNINVAKQLLDAGVSPLAPESIIAADEGNSWDIGILILKRGGDIDVFRKKNYVSQCSMTLVAEKLKSGCFRGR